MLKEFNREDLVALWSLVKEKFSTAVPTIDKEKALWVELTRLFEPNADDVFWKLQRYMHDPLTWKLYTNYGVHHVSSTRKHDIFMLTEKDYPLSNAVMIMMLSAKLQVEEDSKMARDLVMKIFMEANKPKSRSLDTSSNVSHLVGLDLSKLAIILNMLKKIHSKGLVEDGVNFLIGDHSLNLYTIALNEVASNSLNCLLAKASSSQSWLWHQQGRYRTDNGTEFKNKTLAMFFDENRSIIHKRFDKTPYELINKRKQNIKFFRVFGCRCYLLNDYEDVGKLKAKGDIGVFVGYSKESSAFRIYNKRTRKIHESVNVNFDEILEMASKQFSLEPGLSNLNKTGKSSNPLVSNVDEASKKDLEDLFQEFYDEYFDSSKIMKSSTTNVETPINEEVFHEVYFKGNLLHLL
nr:hypothetical protein [Tanacetum cinerariifolium]